MMAIQTRTELPSLKGLLQGLVDDSQSYDIPISGISTDSRTLKKDNLFIALDGTRTSGSTFIKESIDRGASAILMESGQKNMDFNLRVPVIPIDKLKSRLGLMASRYYRDPSRDLNIIGITGTNGKTSIAYYLAQLFSKAESGQIGSIGTLGAGVFGQLKPGINTTPDVFTINELLSDFRAKQIRHVVMEVSSHGLEQGRVDNIRFETAVFTNLSRDHLDYHGDMVAYGEAKRKLFTSPGLKNAVINIDDEYGSRLFSELHNRINSISYGIVSHSSNASVKPEVNAEILVQDINSLSLNINSPWGSSEVILPLSGEFNAHNVLACLAVLCLHDIQFDNVLESLRGLKPVPGRMEAFVKEGYPGIFVDYSHTPDALKHALSYLKDHCKGRLVCVFGCGGDRDKGKRPVMGATAEQYADLVYLTSDNPRNEPPEQIIDDIRKGMEGLIPIAIEQDRTMSITEAINSAKPEDVILIAGKGHETYQEIGNTRLPFSDRQLVRNLLEGGK